MQGFPETDIAYLTDGTLEGLLSAIFDSFQRHELPQDVFPAARAQLRLGERTHEVATDLDHAERVRIGLVRICGAATFDSIRTASVSDDPKTQTICLRFAHYAMERNAARWHNRDARLHDATQDIANAEVSGLFALERSVLNERHYMVQFLRFQELEGGIWFAKCSPKTSVVPLLMDYFCARFNSQPFIIYDERHHLAGVYEQKPLRNHRESWQLAASHNSRGALSSAFANAEEPTGTKRSFANTFYLPNNIEQQHTSPHRNRWYLVSTDQVFPPEATENERLMQACWQRFYDALTIDVRYHPELRRSFMPVRFWDNLPEMHPRAHN